MFSYSRQYVPHNLQSCPVHQNAISFYWTGYPSLSGCSTEDGFDDILVFPGVLWGRIWRYASLSGCLTEDGFENILAYPVVLYWGRIWRYASLSGCFTEDGFEDIQVYPGVLLDPPL